LILIAYTAAKYKGKILIVGNTGSNCTAEASYATKKGFAAGMDASLLINPYYGKTSNRGIIMHLESGLKFGPAIIYNVPGRTGQDIKPEVIMQIAGHKHFAGVKECMGHERIKALSDQGVMYTTGSAEFGQLANGETGEHFITANKLAFNNSFGFYERTVFVENDPNDGSSGDLNRKTATIKSKIKIQDVAAGKHHGLALEAPSVGSGVGTRIFSWGCGNYGVLGHGRQKDEYYPRHVTSFQRGMTITKLGAGANCSLALTKQGHVYYWGNHRSNADAVMKPQLVDALANNQHNVTHIGAGPGNVVCTTDLGNTVVWGAGPYGELGLDGKKSSAKPAFVESISGLVVSDMAVGQGSVLYVIKDDKTLPKADLEAIEACLK